MRKYEVMYIIRSNVEEETVQAINDKFQAILSTGGMITDVNVMGKRRLAYEINDFRDGIYVLIHFEAVASTVRELDRVMRITDEVMRFLIVQDVAS